MLLVIVGIATGRLFRTVWDIILGWLSQMMENFTWASGTFWNILESWNCVIFILSLWKPSQMTRKKGLKSFISMENGLDTAQEDVEMKELVNYPQYENISCFFSQSIFSPPLFLAQYARNPQYFVNLSDPDKYDDESHCPVIISLAQKQEDRKCENAIGFKIYECDLTTRTLDETFIRQNSSVSQSFWVNFSAFWYCFCFTAW